MTFKQVPTYPAFEINRDGIVQHAKTKLRVNPQTLSATHDVVHLGFEIYGSFVPFIVLLKDTFWNSDSLKARDMRSNPMLLPRDGNFLNLKEDNLFPFEVSTNCRIRYTSDIHGVWRAAQVEQVPCNKMADRLNLPQFGAHEFRVLIGEILLEGIR